jgi:hypothetical protein
MLVVDLKEWIEQVQPRILAAGLSCIPNSKRAEIAGNFEREFHVEFETPQDELMFILRFMS